MKKDSYIIDRIEENYVVCETDDGFIEQISSEKISGKFNEGDVLLKDGQYFKVSQELTKERREKIEQIMKDMWQ